MLPSISTFQFLYISADCELVALFAVHIDLCPHILPLHSEGIALPREYLHIRITRLSSIRIASLRAVARVLRVDACTFVKRTTPDPLQPCRTFIIIVQCNDCVVLLPSCAN